MRASPTPGPDRLTRKTERALTVATVLGAVEIVRRSPRWLLLLAGAVVVLVVVVALTYTAWVVAVLGAVVAWRLGRGLLRGWRGAG